MGWDKKKLSNLTLTLTLQLLHVVVITLVFAIVVLSLITLTIGINYIMVFDYKTQNLSLHNKSWLLEMYK